MYAVKASTLVLSAVALAGCPLPEDRNTPPSSAKNIVSTPPEMLHVPAGTFEMGNPFEGGPGFPDEKPVHTVTLFEYEIAKFEITNQQVADVYNWAWENGRITETPDRFVIADDTVLIWIRGIACLVSFENGQFVVETKDGVYMGDYPMVEISWYGAVYFCNWLSEIHGLEPVYDTTTWLSDRTKNGYRLPTEAEWERAAGWTGTDHLTYGTGSHECDCLRANIGRFLCNILGFETKPLLTPVGYFNGENGTIDSPSPIGAYDMSGSVSEWVEDWYAEDYYEYSPEVDPDGPVTGTVKARRGGSWLNARKLARTAARQTLPPGEAYDNTGLRLARTPGPAFPRFTSEIADSDLELGTRFRYLASATGDPEPTFALLEFPDGMTVNARIGRVLWLPTADQLGVANVTLAAMNSLGSAEQSWTITVVDTRPPTRPQELVATDIASHSAVLTWLPSTDKDSVSGYLLYEWYRNSSVDKGWRLVKDNIGGTSTFINGLAADTVNRFRVSAFDPSGNESGLSRSVSFSTLP